VLAFHTGPCGHDQNQNRLKRLDRETGSSLVWPLLRLTRIEVLVGNSGLSSRGRDTTSIRRTEYQQTAYR
jgi:hypothetical protein